jgi:hypothetical protein
MKSKSKRVIKLRTRDFINTLILEAIVNNLESLGYKVRVTF